MSVSLAKQHGIHYTPERLAEFLAKSILSNRKLKNPITVLDPACGDGGLLIAIYRMLSKRHRESAKFLGYERDEEAKVVAEQRLFEAGARHVKIHVQDFLEIDGMQDTEMPLFGSPRKSLPKVDIVISNPPYVRTQVIGAKKSQGLAKQFGLTGRVDLYHAFAFAMGMCLKPNGVLGLLTSNRFLTVKSGEKLRELLTSQFSIDSVFDLGDTKLFNAAVLPAIIVATKSENPGNKQAFDRIYESRNTSSKHRKIATSLWGVLGDRRVSGRIETTEGKFLLERGELTVDSKGGLWALSNAESRQWLDTVRRHQVSTFDEKAVVRVGVKTTADKVFIVDPTSFEQSTRPEASLLHPLITHHCKSEWFCDDSSEYLKTILYPHVSVQGEKQAVDLDDYPKAKSYLELHKVQLANRKYLIDAGRNWYELWVSHQPDDWEKPKIVFPDISETPRFWLDTTGVVVNGDCYWITLQDQIEPDWLYLMLGVANSTFIAKFYDVKFHNKLYAGRRRFMTQYVKQFPLPDPSQPPAKKIVAGVKKMMKSGVDKKMVTKLNDLVWKSFGLMEKV